MSDIITKVIHGETLTVDDFDDSIFVNLLHCSQTRQHHREGNVAEHTLLAVQQAKTIGPGNTLLHLAALLHDVGKPVVTKEREDGSFSAHKHAEVGSEIVNLLLNQHPELQKLTFTHKVELFSLVRNHMLTYAPDTKPGKYLLLSHHLNPENLVKLWKADGRGRYCDDPHNVEYRIAYAQEVLKDAQAHHKNSYGVLETLPEFTAASSATQREIFAKLVNGEFGSVEAARAHVCASEKKERRRSVTYLVGLPGVGKSTWAANWEKETGGTVLCTQNGRKKDRVASYTWMIENLYKCLTQNIPVLVDATNLKKETRKPIIHAATLYDAPLHAVYFDTSLPVAIQRQNTRPAEDSIPQKVLTRMCEQTRYLERSEYTTLTVVDTKNTY